MGEKLICQNPTARSDYFIHEVVEAGIILQGTEVKSIRKTAPQLKESFIEVLSGPRGALEAFIAHLHIAPYSHGNIWNHEPLRRRKLLLHRHQIEKIFGSIQRDGMTAVPLRMYFKDGTIKLELGLAKGKKKHDRREDQKKKSAQKEIAQAMKAHRGKSR